MFVKEGLVIPAIEQLATPDGRRYRTPEGNLYPSVTNILKVVNEEHLKEWKEAVGEDEAKRVSKQAADRGTRIHTLCENHLLGNEIVITDYLDTFTYKSLVPELNKISDVHCLEAALYSNYLKAAGTVDCVGVYDGKLSIIDYKTSTRLKYRDEIHSYFFQTASYAVMFEERTGIPVPQLVIIMAVDFDRAYVFVEKRNDWIKGFIEVRRTFKQKYSI